jgi:hypothetical protein
MSFVPCDILSPDERDQVFSCRLHTDRPTHSFVQAIGYVVRYLVNFDPANPAASGLFSVYIRMVMPDLAYALIPPSPFRMPDLPPTQREDGTAGTRR